MPFLDFRGMTGGLFIDRGVIDHLFEIVYLGKKLEKFAD